MKKLFLSLIAVALPVIAGAQDIETLLPKAQAGDPTAMVKLADLYANSWDEGAPDKAVSWYKKAADAGSSDAMFALYEAYNLGMLGLQSNDDTAKAWLEKAAAKGNAKAYYRQGTDLLFEDQVKAIKLIGMAAEGNCSEAQLYLAKYYSNSWSGEYNPAKGFEWAKKAAMQDSEEVGEAQYLLATFYLKGVGTAANKTEALKWLKKAGENKYTEALTILEWL